MFFVLLLCAAYCLRVFEAPANPFHAVYFWNQLWLVVVTMSTVGYGDNVPATHLGRFTCVAVMLMGTVLVSLMTAAATAFLDFSMHEDTLFEHAQQARQKKELTETCATYMQYCWRVHKGYEVENFKRRNQMRREFWHQIRLWQDELDEMAEQQKLHGGVGVGVSANAEVGAAAAGSGVPTASPRSPNGRGKGAAIGAADRDAGMHEKLDLLLSSVSSLHEQLASLRADVTRLQVAVGEGLGGRGVGEEAGGREEGTEIPD